MGNITLLHVYCKTHYSLMYVSTTIFTCAKTSSIPGNSCLFMCVSLLLYIRAHDCVSCGQVVQICETSVCYLCEATYGDFHPSIEHKIIKIYSVSHQLLATFQQSALTFQENILQTSGFHQLIVLSSV